MDNLSPCSNINSIISFSRCLFSDRTRHHCCHYTMSTLSWLTGLLLVVLVHTVSSATSTDSPTTASTPTLEQPLTSSTTEASPQVKEEVLPHEPRFPLKDLIIECFATLSLPCAQRKLLVYLDQLNRARSVSILWDFMELVRVSTFLPCCINDLQIMV